MPTPVDTIQYTKGSQYLASKAVQRGSLFGKSVNTNLPTVLAVEGYILSWLYDIDSSNTALQSLANYCWGLDGSFGLTAQGIISGGGGSVTPGTPTVLPAPYQFEVDASSFMVTGQSTKTISTFIGRNLLFIRNGITQSTVNTGGTYYSWDSSSGIFTCYGAASEAELFQLFAV